MQTCISFKEGVAESSRPVCHKGLSILHGPGQSQFPKGFSASGKARVENRAKYKMKAIIFCSQWSWRIKNYSSLMKNDPEVQPPPALHQSFSLATCNPLMWFVCQASAQLQQSINSWIFRVTALSSVTANARPRNGTFWNSYMNQRKCKKDKI